MAISLSKTSIVSVGSINISIGSLINASPASNNPKYLVVSALDRNVYTKGATCATGTFSANGQNLNLGAVAGEGDERGAGIVYTYNAVTGVYSNATYGALSDLFYTSSDSLMDVTNISLYGSNNLTEVMSCVADPYEMMQASSAICLGSLTVATQQQYQSAVQTGQATPSSIAASAQAYVGAVWNLNGCWALASDIAADAGAGLPVSSTLVGIPGTPNGEWLVAFNGPAGDTGDWRSNLKVGEMVVVGFTNGGGHIATVVNGSGINSQLIDNVQYVNSSGQLQNSANDGDPNDLIIQSAHSAYGEFLNVDNSTVVVYELDTPIITALSAGVCSENAGDTRAVSNFFSASDPSGRSIVQYQAYVSSGSGELSLNGALVSSTSPSSAVTSTSLSAISLVAGNSADSDQLMVRGFNGSYWGDWQSATITVNAPQVQTPPVQPPPVQPPPAQVLVVDNTTNTTIQDFLSAYDGPVSGLEYQYGNISSDNLSIIPLAANNFIFVGSGLNSIDVSHVGGRNVLYGGAGSNFLVGGSGAGSQDTFFVEARSPSQTVWSTIDSAHSGDEITVWGVSQNDHLIQWADAQGAPGHTGLTMHATSSGHPESSFTLAGFSSADLSNGHLSVSFGNTSDATPVPYMYVKIN